jgi:hypothetical protein
MSDCSNATKNQPQIDPHHNHFFVVQEMFGLAGATIRKPFEQTPVSDEQIETYRKQNGMMS